MDKMKDYKQLIRELPSNTIVCAIGEFNPPTVGHELLVKTVKKLAEQKSSAHVIYTSPSKNSLIQEEKKEHYLNLMFPKTKFKSLSESNLQEVITELHKKYKKIILVVGTEQITEMRKLQNVELIPVDKDPEADNTKMKQFASKGIYEDFKKKLPSTIRDIDGKRLMNEMRTGLGLEPIKEQIVFVKDLLREKYFRGEIFNEGDIVESNGDKFTIVKRGSNHLLLKESTGKLISKWIQDVKPTEEKEMNESSKLAEAVIQPNGTDKIDTKTSEPTSDVGKFPEKTVKKGMITFYNYTKAQKIKEQHKGKESQADHHKDNESDIDADHDSHKTDKKEVGHTLVSPGGQDNLRRRKVKYHLGEQSGMDLAKKINQKAMTSYDKESGHENTAQHIATNPEHTAKQKKLAQSFLSRMQSVAENITPDKASNEVAKANLMAKHAKEKESLAAKHTKEKENLQTEETLDELSTDLLTKYKTGASASAKAADASGDYAKGDKRFKGINKATTKQFDNDLKKHGQYQKEEVEISEAAPFKTKEDAVKYAKEKVKTHRDNLDGIEIHTHSGGFDVNHTSNSSGRNSLQKIGAKHLGTIYKEEVTDHYKNAEKHLDASTEAKRKGDMFSYHMHLADHHGSMSDWHYSKGRNDAGDKHADKAADHEMSAHAMKEQVEPATGDLKDACWKGYTAVGTKKKNGKTVPNCVPEEAPTTLTKKSFDPFFEHAVEENYDQTIEVATPDTVLETSEENDIDDKEIEAMIGNLSDEDIMDDYDEDELGLVDDETGEEIPKSPEEDALDEQSIMEVLSRMERMKAKFRIRRTAAKRERATKIALKRYSNTATINKRSRRLAIKLMKQRLLRGRDASKLSVGEKERIERTIEKRKAVIGRIATRLVSRVRKVEKARMSHSKYTQGSQPSVF
jgi:hypothetical protein